MTVDGVRAELAVIFSALEGIQHRLQQLTSQSDSEDTTAAPPGGVVGPTGPRFAAAVDAPIGPTGPRSTAAVDGPIGPTGPRFAAAVDAPIGPTGPRFAAGVDAPIGPTGPRYAIRPELPPRASAAPSSGGVIGPTGPRRAVRLESQRTAWTTDGEPTDLVLPSGAPVQLAPGARWIWVDGVLVVY